MKKLALCGVVVAALLVTAVPAGAARSKPLVRCNPIGMASLIKGLHKRALSCNDARVVVRSVEAHSAQCRPYRQETIAPFRQCNVIAVLSTGQRGFVCRSAYAVQGNNKRWWRTRCRSRFGDLVTWQRDGNHI
jgi:hypothetical protein